jgi:hypothetical protein
VAAVEIFTFPWSLLAMVVGSACGRFASVRLVGFAWQCRWLFLAIAAVDLYTRRHWPGLVMLLLTSIATITTSRWNKAWGDRRIAMADDLERPQRAAASKLRSDVSARPAGRRASRPSSSRGVR